MKGSKAIATAMFISTVEMFIGSPPDCSRCKKCRAAALSIVLSDETTMELCEKCLRDLIEAGLKEEKSRTVTPPGRS